MIKRIIKLPFKAAKGTLKIGRLAYRTAATAVLGLAAYKAVQKVIKTPPEGLPPPPKNSKEE